MSMRYKMLGKRAASVFLALVLGCFPVSVSAQEAQVQGGQNACSTGEDSMLPAGAGDVSGNVSGGNSVSASDIIYLNDISKDEVPEVPEGRSVFFTNPITNNGISVRIGDGSDEDVKREHKSGKDCFTVDPETGTLFLYCDVDDAYLNSDVQADIEITVEYLDSGTGKFALQYDAGNSSDGIFLEDSGEWKKHTILLKNYAFGNHMNGGDFRIGLYAPTIGISSQPVSFASVTVKKLAAVAVKPDVVSAGGKVGHIFRNQEPYDLSIALKNLDSRETKVAVSYKVVNYNGNVLLSGSLEQRVGAEETALLPLDLSGIGDYGTYSLELEVSDDRGGEKLVKSFPFSRILADREGGMEGMGVGCHFAQGKGDPAKNLPIAKQAGIKWIRDEMYWESAEKEKGVVEVLPAWDSWVNESIANGLETVLILDYSNPLYKEGIGSQEWMDGFTNYCRVLARHFKGRIDTFEIWNEWNGGMGLPSKLPVSEYCKVLVAASAAVREVNPDAFIIGGATAGADITWLQQMAEYPGVYEAIDAVSMHPYTYPASPENAALAGSVEKLGKIFGDRPAKEIWLTEIGWPTHTTNTGVDEAMSGAYAVRMYTWALANQDKVDKIFWYDLQNDGMSAEINEDNFGLIRSWNPSETVPWSAKANYAALSAFTSKVSGTEFRRQCDFGKGIYAYEFAKADGTKVIVMWSNGSAVNVTLDVGTDNVIISDLNGNGQEVVPTGGLISVTAADAPVYLEGAFSQDVTAAEDGFVFESLKYSVTAGAEFPVAVVRSGSFKELDGSYEVLLPDGWKVRNTQFAAGTARDEIFIEVPEGLTEGAFQITVKPVSGGRIMGSFVLKAVIVNQCSVAVNPMYVAESGWKQWKVRATVHNNASASQMKGKIEFLEPAAWAEKYPSQDFVIDGSGEGEFIFDVPENPGQELYHVKMRVTPEGLDPIVINKPVSFLGAMEAEKPIMIDGIFSEGEWDDSMSFVMGEEDFVTLGGVWTDIETIGYVKWDQENLYLAVDVKDASHYQTGKGSDVWGGDSIQFCIDPGRNVKPGISGFNEIGFALNSENGNIYHWKWISATGGTELEDARFMVKREGGKTTYEAAVPWKNLVSGETKIAPGLNVGFSLLLNNNDINAAGESGRTGFLEYMSGIGLNKDAELFGDLILVAADNKPDPEKPDPEKPDPEKPDPEKPGPEKPDPEKPDPETPDPEKPGPENPDPEKPGPEKPDPEKPAPDKPGPDRPNQDIPNNPDPGQDAADAGEVGNGKTSPVTGDFSETVTMQEKGVVIPCAVLAAVFIGAAAIAVCVWRKKKSDNGTLDS